MRDSDLDPPPVQGDLSGGMSDKALLIISTIGFALLGTAMYVFLLSKVSDGDEDEDGEGERNWDDELDEADVRTLNRAQRRARAKNRMKKNRRVAPLAQPRRDGEGGDGGEHDEGQQQQQPMLEADHGSDGEEEGDVQPVQQHLSRKERTRLAKQAEREERRLYEEERREARKEAEEKAAVERRERERDARVAAEEERRREATEAEEREGAEHEEWMMMFVKRGCPEADAVTVRDFVDYVKRRKVVAIDDVAVQFRVPTKDVVERLRQLEKEGRINGVINDQGDYIYLSPDDMRAIAEFVKQKGSVTMSELAEESSRLLLAESEGCKETDG